MKKKLLLLKAKENYLVSVRKFFVQIMLCIAKVSHQFPLAQYYAEKPTIIKREGMGNMSILYFSQCIFSRFEFSALRAAVTFLSGKNLKGKKLRKEKKSVPRRNRTKIGVKKFLYTVPILCGQKLHGPSEKKKEK